MFTNLTVTVGSASDWGTASTVSEAASRKEEGEEEEWGEGKTRRREVGGEKYEVERGLW